jgi:hypothetical protein
MGIRMTSAPDTQLQEILDRPWDISEPSYTHHTRIVETFLLFLKQPDSKGYSLEMDAWTIRIRLLGPHANEIVFRANREYFKGESMIPREAARKLVEALRRYPKSGTMGYDQRVRLAAQVAMFLGLDNRVR